MAYMTVLFHAHTGIGSSSEEQLSSMSEGDFFQWLQSRGISEKDCKALSGKLNVAIVYMHLLLDQCAYHGVNYNFLFFCAENGVTPSGFIQLDAEDFNDIGLTKIGRKLVLKTLAEISACPS